MSLPRTPLELGEATDDVVSSFSNDSVATAILSERAPTAEHRYRGIPEPEATVESLQETVSALKEVVEILIGVRGDTKLTALKVGDAIKMNDALQVYLEGLIP